MGFLVKNKVGNIYIQYDSMIAVNIFSLVCRNDPPIEVGECVAYSCKVCTSEWIGASEWDSLHPRRPSFRSTWWWFSFRPETGGIHIKYNPVLFPVKPFHPSLLILDPILKIVNFIRRYSTKKNGTKERRRICWSALNNKTRQSASKNKYTHIDLAWRGLPDWHWLETKEQWTVAITFLKSYLLSYNLKSNSQDYLQLIKRKLWKINVFTIKK